MNTESRLHNLFPTAAEIPEQYRLGAPIEQREYLVDGALRRWEGPLATVRSPIHLKTDKGDQQVVLGSTPLLDAEAALTALDAAVKAYDNGQG
ncbi:glyceraldehyde-3-phosphate dehydrogenase (NADP+), partial [Azotobacter beijerinckii]